MTRPKVSATSTLECDHCGGTAIASTRPGGVFHDGEGVSCDDCGMPGGVVVDEREVVGALRAHAERDKAVALVRRWKADNGLRISEVNDATVLFLRELEKGGGV